MSDRGTFVAEWLYCERCFDGLISAIRSNENFADVWSVAVRGVVAGRVASTYPGGEVQVLDVLLREDIERAICHSIRIAVLADAENHDSVVRFKPSGMTFPES